MDSKGTVAQIEPLLVAVAQVKFVVHPMNVIDLIAIIPYYISLILGTGIPNRCLYLAQEVARTRKLKLSLVFAAPPVPVAVVAVLPILTNLHFAPCRRLGRITAHYCSDSPAQPDFATCQGADVSLLLCPVLPCASERIVEFLFHQAIQLMCIALAADKGIAPLIAVTGYDGKHPNLF